MSSVQRFLSNQQNVAGSEVPVANSVKASPNSVFPSAPDREGTGGVRLSGSFTGDEDKVIDIKITAETSTQLTISQPVHSGVGNGEITGIAASGLTPQDIEVTLKDLGTPTRAASVEFFGKVLQAKSAGAAGNNIRLTVTLTGITYTDLGFATIEIIREDQELFIGSQWNFGAYPLDGDGLMNASTIRISFGVDNQVYRQYLKYDASNRPNYYLTPAAVREIPAGTRVKQVTGIYSVTITNGSTTETCSVTTLYDLLAWIRDNSTLLEVVGVISQDRTPGGMAMMDMPLRTKAYNLSIQPDGSTYVEELTTADLDLSIDEEAPTELVTVECEDNTTVGQELWKVKGDVTGLRSARAMTGIAYEDDDISFEIPEKTPSQTEKTFRVIEPHYYTTRAEGESIPPICVDLYPLGPAAVPKEITLRYTAKPTLVSNCECEDVVDIEGRWSSDCSGIPEEEIEMEGGDAIVQQSVKKRYEDLLTWFNEFVEANTTLATISGGEDIPRGTYTDVATAVLSIDRVDIYAAELIRDLFVYALSEIDGFAGNNPDAWEASTAYAVGDIVQPTTPNEHFYKCVVAGTSGGTEPGSWDTTWGRTTDNTVTWEDQGLKPVELFDDLFASMDTDMSGLEDAQGGDFWKCLGVDVPSFPTWQATTLYKEGLFILPTVYNGFYYEQTASGSGTTDSSEPDWPTNVDGEVQDATCVWQSHLLTDYIEEKYISGLETEELRQRVGYWIKRYEPQIHRILAAAEITPPFQLPSSQSTGTTVCWEESDGSYCWVINSNEYLYAVTNRIYHSVKSRLNDDTGELEIYPTKEFSFVIKVNPECTAHLKEGDTITLQIGGTLKTYQPGDKIVIPVINAAPLYLSGGQDGSNIITWTVRGSVDGAFADYALNLDSPAAYSDSGLEFLISQGGIPFAVGYMITFSIEGGKFKWREDGGAWSSELDILSAGVSITDGLTAYFDPGTAPSFLIDDLFSFTVMQPNAPSHVQSPDFERWVWDTASPTITIALGGTESMSALALVHDIPSGASITIKGSMDGFSTEAWSESVTWRENLIVHFLASTREATHVRITMTSATGGSISWFVIGVPISTSLNAQQVVMTREYDPSWGGKGWSPEVAWTDFMTQDELDDLISMIDYVKANDEGRLVFIPQYQHPEDSSFVEIQNNRIQVKDRWQFQPLTRTNRMISVGIPMTGILQ